MLRLGVYIVLSLMWQIYHRLLSKQPAEKVLSTFIANKSTTICHFNHLLQRLFRHTAGMWISIINALKIFDLRYTLILFCACVEQLLLLQKVHLNICIIRIVNRNACWSIDWTVNQTQRDFTSLAETFCQRKLGSHFLLFLFLSCVDVSIILVFSTCRLFVKYKHSTFPNNN